MRYAVRGTGRARRTRQEPARAGADSLLRQGEDGQRATQFGVLVQLTVAAHGAQAVGVLLEACGHTC